MAWRERISGCFGIMDQVFAGHPADSQRAKAMLTEAFEEGASWEDLEREVRAYLTGKCSPEHVEKQVGYLRDVSRYLDGLENHMFTFSVREK